MAVASRKALAKNVAAELETLTRHLGPGQSVFTSDGHRLGRIEAAGCQAFKVGAPAEKPGFWLLREAVERTTHGGSVTFGDPQRAARRLPLGSASRARRDRPRLATPVLDRPRDLMA